MKPRLDIIITGNYALFRGFCHHNGIDRNQAVYCDSLNKLRGRIPGRIIFGPGYQRSEMWKDNRNFDYLKYYASQFNAEIIWTR